MCEIIIFEMIIVGFEMVGGAGNLTFWDAKSFGSSNDPSARPLTPVVLANEIGGEVLEEFESTSCLVLIDFDSASSQDLVFLFLLLKCCSCFVVNDDVLQANS